MVCEELNKAGTGAGEGGRTGDTDTLDYIQYLICNAVLTSAEPLVQCYIDRSISMHNIVHRYRRFCSVIA